MSDTPHTPEASPARRSARHASGPDDVLETLADGLTGNLDHVARLVRLPSLPDGAPQALRTAGVPLVTAALMATGHASAGASPSVTGPATGAPSTIAAAGGSGALTADTPAAPVYRVREGDTLSDIAARTGIGVRTLIEANHLPSTGMIRIGQLIRLPGLSSSAAGAAGPDGAAAAGRTGGPLYVVVPGDTVAAIAARFGITPASIVRANKIPNPSHIRPGQKLRLPGVPSRARTHPAGKGLTGTTPSAKPATAATKATPTKPYTVRPADTLIGIAEAHKVDLAVVLTLNSLTRASVIHPGQVLRLPAPPQQTPQNSFAGRTYPDAVVRAAAANRAALASRDLPSRAQMRQLVQQTAAGMGVDPALALAVAWQESGFSPKVVSPANAIGTMQVIPRTGIWASDLVGRKLDLLQPKDNVTAGVAVLAALLARAEEDQAIAGYYQGLGSVQSRGMFEDTKAYVANVQAHRKRFAAELAKA